MLRFLAVESRFLGINRLISNSPSVFCIQTQQDMEMTSSSTILHIHHLILQANLDKWTSANFSEFVQISGNVHLTEVPLSGVHCNIVWATMHIIIAEEREIKKQHG